MAGRLIKNERSKLYAKEINIVINKGDYKEIVEGWQIEEHDLIDNDFRTYDKVFTKFDDAVEEIDKIEKLYNE